MGNLRASSIFATLALAACGSDHGQNIDAAVSHDAAPDAKEFLDAPAPVYDFSCMGNAAPTTADANITLTGTVQNVSGSLAAPSVAAASGVTVDICLGLCNGQDNLDTQTSAADGSYTTTALATMSMPLDAYVRATRTGDRTIFVYPPAPLTMAPPAMPVLSFTSGFFPTLAQSPSNGMLIVGLVDCTGMPISDSTNVDLIIKQNGTEVTGTTEIDASMFAAQLAGGFLVLNVPPNATTEVGATYKGMAMRAHNVRVVATTTTETLLRPGY